MNVVVADGRRPFASAPLDGTAARLAAALEHAGCRTEVRPIPRLDTSPARAASAAFGLSLLSEPDADLVVALRPPAPLVATDRRTWWAWDLPDSAADLALATAALDERTTVIATSASARDRLQALGLRPLVLRVPAPDVTTAPLVGDAVVVDLACASDRAVVGTLDCARSGHRLVFEDRGLSAARRQQWRALPGADLVTWASDLPAPAAHLGVGALMLGRAADLEGSAAVTAATAGRAVAGPNCGPAAEIGLVTPALTVDPEDADDVARVLSALTSGGATVAEAGMLARRQVGTHLPSWRDVVEVLLASLMSCQVSSRVRSGAGVFA